MTIYELIKAHPTWNLPSHCPECGEELCVDEDATHITCENDGCRTHLLGRLQKWTNTLEIKGFGDAVLRKLLDLGVMSIGDLYQKEFYNALAKEDGYGEKSATKIFEAINATEKKNMSLATFITGLNIKGVGESFAEKIVEHTKAKTVSDLLSLTSSQCVCDGLAETIAEKFTLGLFKLQQEALELEQIVAIKDPKAKATTGGKLAGLSFCFTGAMSKPRKTLETLVEMNGGTVKGVAAGLTYLVQADPSSTSSKTQKAQKLGVKIISEKEFAAMI